MQQHRAAIRHCPRCVGRSRVIVELFSSTLPADVLYGENGLPRADSEPAQSSSAAATVSAPKVGRARRTSGDSPEDTRYVVMHIEQDAEQETLPDAIRLANSCERAGSRSC